MGAGRRGQGDDLEAGQVGPSRTSKFELYGPGTDSGTFDYFTDVINGEEGASRSDYNASEDDNVIVKGVGGSPNALGYFGYTYFEENSDTLKAVEVDSGDGCVAPSAETAQDGTYAPLSRPLFIYVNKDSYAKKKQVSAFVDYYVEQDQAVSEAAKFITLNDEQRTELARRSRGAQGLTKKYTAAQEVLRRRNEVTSTVTPRGPSERAAPSGPAPEHPLAPGKRRFGEDIAMGLLKAAAALSVVVTIGIFVSLLLPSIQFFREVHPWDFLSGSRWAPTFSDPDFGVLPLIIGDALDHRDRPAHRRPDRPRRRGVPE